MPYMRSPKSGRRSRVHPLTPEQRRIYDAYAGAFKVIHANIEEALKATGIVQGEDTLNRNAKAAALSAFEGTKQRFFGHLLTGMKCPSTIRAIEADLAAGRSAVVQLVSTGEALMERRIADVPASEWDDLNIDLTPRDAILSYLMHAFPVQLQEPFTDDGGNLLSRPARDRRLARRRRPGDALRASRHRGGHRAGRDRPPRQAGAAHRGIGAGDRQTRPGAGRQAAPRRQRALEARRRHPARIFAHDRRRRGAGAGPADPPRDRRDHGAGRARRFQLAPRRRDRVAPRLGRRDRRAAVAPGVPLLARHRPAAAGLGPPAGREHARAPADLGRWSQPHRTRARRRAGARRARGLRPQRRTRHDGG